MEGYKRECQAAELWQQRATCPKTGENHAMNAFWTEQWIELSHTNKRWLDIVDNAVFFCACHTELYRDTLWWAAGTLWRKQCVLVKSVRTCMLGHHRSTLYQPCFWAHLPFMKPNTEKQDIPIVCVNREEKVTEELHNFCKPKCFLLHSNGKEMEAQKNTSDLVQQICVNLRHKSLYSEFESILFLPIIILLRTSFHVRNSDLTSPTDQCDSHRLQMRPWTCANPLSLRK